MRFPYGFDFASVLQDPGIYVHAHPSREKFGESLWCQTKQQAGFNPSFVHVYFFMKSACDIKEGEVQVFGPG